MKIYKNVKDITNKIYKNAKNMPKNKKIILGTSIGLISLTTIIAPIATIMSSKTSTLKKAKNSFLGTWKNQINMNKFLNLKDTDIITANLFKGEVGLTDLTFVTGKFKEEDILKNLNIKSLTIKNEKITKIPQNAFYNSELTSLDLSGCINLTSIGETAFYNSKLTKLDLSKNTNLKNIEYGSFGNSRLITIDFHGLTKFKILNEICNVSELKTLDLNRCTSLEKINDGAFTKATNLTSLNLRECSSLILIDRITFQNAKIIDLDLSGCIGLTKIMEKSFEKCRLTHLNLSGCIKLKEIETQAFSYAKLKYLNLSGCSSLETIGTYAFAESKLTKLDLSKCTSLTSLKEYSFRDSPLTSLNLKGCNKLKTIEKNVFQNIVNKATTIIKVDFSILKKLNNVNNSNSIFGKNNWQKITGWTIFAKIPKTPEGITLTGKNNQGKIKHPITPIEGVTITTSADGKSDLSNGDTITVTYTLNEGYIWQNSTRKIIKLKYTVLGLGKVKIPKKISIFYTGVNGQGKIKHPITPIEGVTISYSKNDNLFNNDKIIITYTLKEGYTWSDGQKGTKKTLEAEVIGMVLDKIHNSFLGIWNDKTNMNKFLNLKDTDIITANLFKGEVGLTDLTIATGQMKEANFLKSKTTGAINIKNLIINKKDLIIIKDSMFCYSTLTSLDLSGCINLEIIDKSAFFNSKLACINLYKNTKLKKIGENAFRCSELEILDLSRNKKLLKIGNMAFASVKRAHMFYIAWELYCTIRILQQPVNTIFIPVFNHGYPDIKNIDKNGVSFWFN